MNVAHCFRPWFYDWSENVDRVGDCSTLAAQFNEYFSEGIVVHAVLHLKHPLAWMLAK